MSDVRSSSKAKKERNTTTFGVKKEIRERMKNLEFVKKHSYGEIMTILMDFYEENKPQFNKRWKKKK